MLHLLPLKLPVQMGGLLVAWANNGVFLTLWIGECQNRGSSCRRRLVLSDWFFSMICHACCSRGRVVDRKRPAYELPFQLQRAEFDLQVVMTMQSVCASPNSGCFASVAFRDT